MVSVCGRVVYSLVVLVHSLGTCLWVRYILELSYLHIFDFTVLSCHTSFLSWKRTDLSQIKTSTEASKAHLLRVSKNLYEGTLRRIVTWCSVIGVHRVSIYANTIDSQLHTCLSSLLETLNAENKGISVSLLSYSSTISTLQKVVLSASKKPIKDRGELLTAMGVETQCDICISVGKNKGMPLQGIPYTILYSCEMFSLSSLASTSLLDFYNILYNYTRIEQRNGK